MQGQGLHRVFARMSTTHSHTLLRQEFLGEMVLHSLARNPTQDFLQDHARPGLKRPCSDISCVKSLFWGGRTPKKRTTYRKDQVSTLRFKHPSLKLFSTYPDCTYLHVCTGSRISCRTRLARQDPDIWIKVTYSSRTVSQQDGPLEFSILQVFISPKIRLLHKLLKTKIA